MTTKHAFSTRRSVQAIAGNDASLTTTVVFPDGAKVPLVGLMDTSLASTDAGFIALAAAQPTIGATGRLDTTLTMPEEGDGVIVGKPKWKTPLREGIVALLEEATGLTVEAPKPRKGRKGQTVDVDAVAAEEMAAEEAATA